MLREPSAMTLQEILAKNRMLHRKHAGERCFILGCGPSIREQNLKHLAGEVTIAVNRFYFHPDLAELRPEYWVVADPLFWERLDVNYLPLVRALEDREVATRLFMPSRAIEAVAALPGSRAIEPHFFHYDYDMERLDGLDFTRGIPPLGQNVVTPALMLACYMGCREIYLLGCDHSWWGVTEETYADTPVPHFYSQADPDPSHFRRFTFAELQGTIVRQRWEYRQVRAYAEKTGHAIWNATPGGYLDEFQRMRFEDVVVARPRAEDGAVRFSLPRTRVHRWLFIAHRSPEPPLEAILRIADAYLKVVKPGEEAALWIRIPPGTGPLVADVLSRWLAARGLDPDDIPDIVLLDEPRDSDRDLFEMATAWCDTGDPEARALAESFGLERIDPDDVLRRIDTGPEANSG